MSRVARSGAAVKGARVAVALLLAAAVLWAVAGTVHWPIVGDAPLFHYIAFLMDHGKVPYRDIVDINMPGVYALEWAAIHGLGPGALAWRMFDFGLVGVCALAMVAIAWPLGEDAWLGGWLGGALFALLHFRDGPTHTGQRDLMMTALLLPACAALVAAMRRRGWLRAGLLAGFGLLAGMASVVKPSGVLFAAAMMGFLWWKVREERLCGPTQRGKSARDEWGTHSVAGAWGTHGVAGRWGTQMIAAAGFLVPVVACGVWLWRQGAMGAFVALNRGLVPYHAALGRPSFPALLVGSFPSVMLPVVLPALPLLWAHKPWRNAGGLLLMVCVGLGCVSYILQGKGFPYHRYPAEAFLSLGCAILLVEGLRANGWQRWVGATGVLLAVLYLAPVSAAIAVQYDWRNQEFNQQLAGDLTALGTQMGGAAALQGQVQCIDMTAGCLDTLYNLRIVQATGFLYDCYLFQPRQTAVSLRYREDFWRALQAARPRVLVVTDQQCFAMTRDWSGPERWPEFATLLRDEYVLQKQYTPPHRVAWWRKPAVPYSYRLYVRRH